MTVPAPLVAVVIPCYRVRDHVLNVINSIGPEVGIIFAVDDACPDKSGAYIQEMCRDPRVRVVFHQQNKGVGGAVVSGYRAALAAGAEIVVKVDGDGQMDPALLPDFIAPLIAREADYTKGNRFYSYHNIRSMPGIRLFGNAVLSFMTKLSSGYWQMFDPTNGYTAIHAIALRRIDLNHVQTRYFFESDMLIRLGGIRAVVHDIPMEAVYGTEISGLKIRNIIPEFMKNHALEIMKRLVYSYFLRDFSLASVNLLVGAIMIVFGIVFGTVSWFQSFSTGHAASTGTVILAALPIILGVQLVLSFLAFDIGNVPRLPLCRLSSLRPPTQDGNVER